MSTENDDIKPSNHALKQAALWLGVSDPQKLLDEDPAASAFQARPEGLGLGAKFLPHHKAAQLAAPLEKRFQKRLARDATGAEQDDRTPAVAKKPRTAAKATGNPTSGQHDSSSDEDDRGRAGAFATGRIGKQQSQSFAKHTLLTSGKKKQNQAQHQQAKQQKHHTKQNQQRGRPQ